MMACPAGISDGEATWQPTDGEEFLAFSGAPDIDRPPSAGRAFVLLHGGKIIGSSPLSHAARRGPVLPQPSFDFAAATHGEQITRDVRSHTSRSGPRRQPFVFRGGQNSNGTVSSPLAGEHVDSVQQHHSHDFFVANLPDLPSWDALEIDKFSEMERAKIGLHRRPGHVQSASDSRVRTVWQHKPQAQIHTTPKPPEKVVRHRSEPSAIPPSPPPPEISLQHLSLEESDDDAEYVDARSQFSSRTPSPSPRTPIQAEQRWLQSPRADRDYFDNNLTPGDEELPEDSQEQSHDLVLSSPSPMRDGSDDRDGEVGEARIVYPRDAFALILADVPTPRSRTSRSRKLVPSPTPGPPAVIWRWIHTQKRLDKLQAFFCIAEALSKELNMTHQKTGYIYALKARELQAKNYIKIGYTTDPKQRFKAHVACYGACQLIYPVPGEDYLPIKHAGRVEALVHAELVASSWALEQCPRLSNIHSAHTEWFDVDARQATAVIEKWVAWASASPFEKERKSMCHVSEGRGASQGAVSEPPPDAIWRLKPQKRDSIMELCWPLLMAAG